jgi:2-oxoglutarate dehydrogenase E1 component
MRNPEKLKWWQNRLNQNDNHPNYDVEQKNTFLLN